MPTSRQEESLPVTTMLNIVLYSLVSLSTPNVQTPASAVACDTWLRRIEAVAAARSYKLDLTESGLSGHSARDSRMDARCELGHAELHVLDASGAAVSLEFTGAPDEPVFALELTGIFPGVGEVSQTHVLEAKGPELEGFMAFSASMADDFVSVEFAADGSALSEAGDVARANAMFAPVLRASAAWNDTNAVLYGLGGMWSAPEQVTLDALFSIAIPPPHSAAADQDGVYVKRICSASGATCAASLFFPPALAACVAGTAACLAATACYAADCSGDDGPANS